MKSSVNTLLIVLIIGISCRPASNSSSMDQWKNEIIQTEKDFAEMAGSKGISEAFLFFADENAVLERNNVLHIGKQSIADLFSNNEQSSAKAELSWVPDFVDVASSGDLGYTYGRYSYTVTDSDGTVTKTQGIFHTVWKKEPDGSWKYVWD